MKTAMFACLGLLLAACSSTPDKGFTPVEAIAFRSTIGPDTLSVAVTTLPGSCALVQSGSRQHAHDYDTITFHFGTTNGALQPGTYPVIETTDVFPGTNATVFYIGQRDNAGHCQTAYGAPAIGTVTIATMDSSHVTGTYDIQFDHGWPYGSDYTGRVTGTFDAPLCDNAGIQDVICE
jgi:hypothetical protein